MFQNGSQQKLQNEGIHKMKIHIFCFFFNNRVKDFFFDDFFLSEVSADQILMHFIFH